MVARLIAAAAPESVKKRVDKPAFRRARIGLAGGSYAHRNTASPAKPRGCDTKLQESLKNSSSN
jgi:hypothetical protein